MAWGLHPPRHVRSMMGKYHVRARVKISITQCTMIFFFIFYTTLLGILNVKGVKEAGIVVGRSGQFCHESESFKIGRSLGVDKTLAINEIELSNSLLEEMTAIEE